MMKKALWLMAALIMALALVFSVSSCASKSAAKVEAKPPRPMPTGDGEDKTILFRTSERNLKLSLLGGSLYTIMNEDKNDVVLFELDVRNAEADIFTWGNYGDIVNYNSDPWMRAMFDRGCLVGKEPVSNGDKIFFKYSVYDFQNTFDGTGSDGLEAQIWNTSNGFAFTGRVILTSNADEYGTLLTLVSEDDPK